MASGKTLLGRALADRLAMPFVDLDHRLSQECGLTVEQIFARHGEAHFRALEREALTALRDGPPHVLALGGGTMVQPWAWDLLRGRWRLVVLKVPLAELNLRLDAPSGGRPLRSVAAELFDQRADAYRSHGVQLPLVGLDPSQALARIVCAMDL